MQSEWVMSSPSSQEAVYDKDPVCLVWRSLLISRRLLSVVSGECSRRPLLSLSFCSGSQPRSLQQIHHLIQLLSSQVVVVPGADDDQRKHEEEEEAGHDGRERWGREAAWARLAGGRGSTLSYINSLTERKSGGFQLCLT